MFGSTAGVQVQMSLRHKRFLRREQRFAHSVTRAHGRRSPAFLRPPA
jgi:hypothetical protein